MPDSDLMRHRVPWTTTDVRQLIEHSAARTPVKKISKQMQRTEAACIMMARRLKIGLGHNRPRTYR